MNYLRYTAPYARMSDSGSCESSQGSLGGGSIVVAAREAIARGDRQAALRLLRALTLSEPKEVVNLTPATAEALVATAQAEPEERGPAALETYRAAEVTYLVIAEQIRQTPLEREHVAGLKSAAGRAGARTRQGTQRAPAEGPRRGGDIAISSSRQRLA